VLRSEETRFMRILAALAVLGAVAGCSDPTDPVPVGKQLSIVDAGSPSSAIDVADTVAAGLVPVRYHSYGSSSCNRPDGDDVTEVADVITITAYDKYVPPNTPCTEDFGTFPRESIVSLSTGTKEIRVRGLRVGGVEAVLKKTVVVK
jgi:hypothetical protein